MHFHGDNDSSWIKTSTHRDSLPSDLALFDDTMGFSFKKIVDKAGDVARVVRAPLTAPTAAIASGLFHKKTIVGKALRTEARTASAAQRIVGKKTILGKALNPVVKAQDKALAVAQTPGTLLRKTILDPGKVFAEIIEQPVREARQRKLKGGSAKAFIIKNLPKAIGKWVEKAHKENMNGFGSFGFLGNDVTAAAGDYFKENRAEVAASVGAVIAAGTATGGTGAAVAAAPAIGVHAVGVLSKLYDNKFGPKKGGGDGGDFGGSFPIVPLLAIVGVGAAFAMMSRKKQGTKPPIDTPRENEQKGVETP
jgi:hypothetical protein